MNEKFGFLSNFPGFKKTHLKNRAPPHYATPQRELTDNPSIKNRNVNRAFVLTSDEDSENEVEGGPSQVERSRERKKKTRPSQPNTQAKVINILLESSSSGFQNKHDEDRTYCSKLEMRRTSSEPRKSSFIPTVPKNATRETVIGSFSDDDEEEMCSRISDIHVSQKRHQQMSKISDTVIGPFSEISSIYQRTPRQVLRDTILQSFSDDDEPERQITPQRKPSKLRPKKVSLADTVLNSSSDSADSMPELPKPRDPSPVAEEDVDEEDGASQEEEIEASEGEEEASEEGSVEVITVLDSDDEENSITNKDLPVIASNDSFENVSSIQQSSRKTAESDNTLNQFFNNPPTIDDPKKVVSHSNIRKMKGDPSPRQSESPKTIISADRFKQHEEVEDAEDADVEIGETCSENDGEDVTNIGSSEVIPVQVTQEETCVESYEQTETQSTSTNVYGTVNISANINISLKISMRGSSDTSDSSSSEESSSSSADSQPPPKQPSRRPSVRVTPVTKVTPKSRQSKNKPDSARKDKQAATPGSGAKKKMIAVASPLASHHPNSNEVDFVTPSKSDVAVIDEDLQAVLDSLYGNSWKTPQLLASCTSKKVRKDLRKSIHANNLDNFLKNLPQDEGTIGTSSSEESVKKGSAKKKDNFPEFKTPSRILPSSTKKKPTGSGFKTPQTCSGSKREVVKNTPTTPRYLDICDSDTTSDESESDSTDADFNANETWNASSDEEYKDERERIKEKSMGRISRKDEEIIFVPDETVGQNIDDLLDRFEYKKPPSLTPRAIFKKKLFTHTHFDDDSEVPEDEDRNDKENREIAANNKFFVSAFPDPKRFQEIKDSAKMYEPVAKKTPKAKAPSKSKYANNFDKYSFLKSLNCEADPILCNDEALCYRNNYKTKKTELAERLFKLYNEKVFDNQLSEVPITWNKKLLNTAGRCNNSRKMGIRQCLLELSDKVLTSADRLRCTLIHEMCHAATWILQGENGHGSAWKSWAAKANRTFPELPKINVCHDYVIEYRYSYVCVVCKAKYQAHSKSKKVENIRCSVCKSAIELFHNKKEKDGRIVMTPVAAKEVKGFPKFVKLYYSNLKQPNMTHKDVMQMLSAKFKTLSVEQKQNL